MDPTQFRNWQTFAIRMAHRGWPRLPRQSRKKVAEMVKDFFRRLENFDCDGTLKSRIQDWDHTADCKHEQERNAARLPNGNLPSGYPPFSICYDLVCDAVTMMSDSWNPFTWSDERKAEKWDDLWLTRVNCCLRAGLDLASLPSAGVVGFEVCDLRRMYRGNIPAWINAQWVDAMEQPIDLNKGECAVGIWL
jgi:hypothetical protein